MTQRLIILDRDGVINHDSDAYIKAPEEWRPIAGSLEAIARLSRAGYRIAIATNQSGLARGLFDRATLDAIHQHLRERVTAAGGRIDWIALCPHGPDDHCACRKPRPGLLLEIAEHFGMNLTGVPVIGDSRRDLQAALAAGAQPWLVLSGNGQRTLAQLRTAPEIGIDLNTLPIYPDLSAATTALLDSLSGS